MTTMIGISPSCPVTHHLKNGFVQAGLSLHLCRCAGPHPLGPTNPQLGEWCDAQPSRSCTLPQDADFKRVFSLKGSSGQSPCPWCSNCPGPPGHDAAAIVLIVGRSRVIARCMQKLVIAVVVMERAGEGGEGGVPRPPQGRSFES